MVDFDTCFYDDVNETVEPAEPLDAEPGDCRCSSPRKSRLDYHFEHYLV